MKLTLYIACLLVLPAIGQGEIGRIFEELPEDTLIKKELRWHSSLKPAIRVGNNTKNELHVSGLADINYLYDTDSKVRMGAGAEFSALLENKWHIRLAAVQGYTTTYSLPKSYLSKTIDQGALYTDIRSRVSYTPNHIFNFQVGVDHNYLGEGARSLLLSDYGNPYPFGLIRANFWRFEYAVLYQFMRERDQQRWEGKFASSHHISFNAAKWLNIGIFETVIFQPKDTLLNRGFDVEYLNPFVFYRPQEYSLGSSDNVLLGLDFSADIKNYTIYGQMILDEFYLSELRARTGWWANKFGGQLGTKARYSIGKHKFFCRAEYNFVRPYTYAHLSEDLNYGNQGYGLAHPYGANFMEALGEIKWNHEKWSARLFVNYFLYGRSKDGKNYGGNIYEPYTNRPYEYGHFIGQGDQLNGTNIILTSAYRITKHGNLQAFMENHLRLRYSKSGNTSNYMFVMGIRSLLWNDYRNY